MEHPVTTPSKPLDRKHPEQADLAIAVGLRSLLVKDEETKVAEPLQTAPLTVPTAPTAVTRRRRSYGQQRVSEDHKRERNRATFRRFYQRKQQTLRELREEVEVLTVQYEQLKRSRVEGTGNHVADPSIVRLISEKDRLAAEHAELLQLVQDQLKVRRLLQRLLDNTEDDSAMPLVRLPPLSVDTKSCVDQAIVQLRELDVSPGVVEDAFGWQCWSQVRDDGHYVAFHVTKHFAGVSATDTARRTWQHCWESTTHTSQTPASLIRSYRRVLPRPEEEGTTRLVFRQFVRVNGETTSGAVSSTLVQAVKSVSAVALLQLPTKGWAVVSSSVPNQEMYDPGDGDDPHVVTDLFPDRHVLPRHVDDEWIQQLSWWRFEPSETGVDVTYAGRAPVSLGLSPSACFMEALQRAVQWEQVVVGATPIDVTTLKSLS